MNLLSFLTICCILLVFGHEVEMAGEWERPEILFRSTDYKENVEISDMLVTADDLITHMIIRLKSNYIYAQLAFNNTFIIKRNIEPRDSFYSVSRVCLSSDRNLLTIVATVDHNEQHTGEIWYMDSNDHGKTWSEFRKVPKKDSESQLTRDISCPVVYINETKRMFAFYTMSNMSDPNRPMILAMATRAPGSKVFAQERIISEFPQYRANYWLSAGYTMKNAVAILHLVSCGNDKPLYMKSENNGVTWTKPRILFDNADISKTPLMLAYKETVILSFFPSHDKPLTLVASHDHGNTWNDTHNLPNTVEYVDYSLKLCKARHEPYIAVYAKCSKGGLCLYESEQEKIEFKEVQSPLEKEGTNAYFACPNDKTVLKDSKVVFSNFRDEDYTNFVVSHYKEN